MELFQELRDKIVIITGASSGIGASAAVEFAKLGCRLTLTGRNKERLDKTVQKCMEAGLKEEDVLVKIADIRVEEDIKSVVDDTIAKFGTIHVLVNNAGVSLPSSVINSPVTCLDEMFNLHVRSIFTMVQLSLEHLKENKGSVINISSVYATDANSKHTSYCVAKAAQDQLTRCMAQDLAKYGIRVNSVSPGHIYTGMAKAIFPEMSEAQIDKIYMETLPNQHVLGRVGRPEEIARPIVFLASKAASFITGEQLYVDGGYRITSQ